MNPLLESVMGPLLTVHQWLSETTDGRIGASLGGRPMLLLRTVGRRTGEPRTAALLYVRDRESYAVIASTGGAPRHPGWFHNLVAEPNVEIQVGRERVPVRSLIADGEERSRLWARADDVNQGQYTIYQSRMKFMSRRFARCRMVVENSRQLVEWEKTPDAPDADPVGLMNRSFAALAEPI